jgi:universal stress protein E
MLKFSNILVHYDSRADNHPGVKYAAELAKANSGRLKIVEMIPDFPWLTRQFVGGYERVIEDITQAKARHLDEVAGPFREQGIAVTTKVLDGRTSVAMIHEVLRDDHDLVIKVAKGQHSRQTGFFGTTATRLLRKCPCPVLILKPDHPCCCERVVAAVSAIFDGGLHAKLNKQIIRLATEAATNGSPQIVSAWSVYGEDILKDRMNAKELDELRDQAHRHAERKLDDLLIDLNLGIGSENVRVLSGEPAEVISNFVHEHDTDLLVMGTVARAGIAGLLTGNTAEHLLNRVECSVLAIKPEGFVSPLHE